MLTACLFVICCVIWVLSALLGMYVWLMGGVQALLERKRAGRQGSAGDKGKGKYVDGDVRPMADVD